MHSQRKSQFPKPRFEGWRLAKYSSALQIFQILGSIVSLILIGSVGSQFPPTYAALLTCVFSCIGAAVFVLCDAFNLKDTEPDEWVFWESVFVASFSFLFTINTMTMLYSSIRWNNTAWWLATVSLSMPTNPEHLMVAWLSG
uniref:MARVEL domain-containing protein n=1 Tax=Caenorhabditis tropicalis TaxID=1561998 RepID=A0A1I7T8E1_9PELO